MPRTCSMDAVSDSSTKKVDCPERMWSRAPYSFENSSLLTAVVA